LQPTHAIETKENVMVARTWRGWTAADCADEVAARLRDGVISEFAAAPGYIAAYVLCRPIAGGVEVMTLSLWESADALPAEVEERHRLLVARQTVPACWDIVGESAAIAAAA
jgi:Antibiotic biosynthesis monooxygenase